MCSMRVIVYVYYGCDSMWPLHHAIPEIAISNFGLLRQNAPGIWRGNWPHGVNEGVDCNSQIRSGPPGIPELIL